MNNFEKKLLFEIIRNYIYLFHLFLGNKVIGFVCKKIKYFSKKTFINVINFVF